MTDRRLWQTGCSTVYTNSFNDEILNEFKNADINFMELSFGKYYEFENINYIKNAKEIFTTAKEFDVSINSIHLPFAPFEEIDISSSNPALRQNTVQKLSILLEISADSGIKLAVIHPSGEPINDEERKERFKFCEESLYVLTEKSREFGIKLAIENLPRTCLCNVKEEMAELLQNIQDLYVCFDTNHSLQQSNIDFIREVGHKIIALHISDYDFKNEMHLLPGMGLINWDELFSCLEKANYEGIFMCEVPSRDNVTLINIKNNHKMLINNMGK